MAMNFKKQVSQHRAAVPQLDPEGVRPTVPLPIAPNSAQEQDELSTIPQSAPSILMAPSKSLEHPQPDWVQPPTDMAPAPQTGYRITIVDTTETPVNRGFSMYPSRHRQVAKDLAYIEDRNPWEIIETALEEYVVKHYGKSYKRR